MPLAHEDVMSRLAFREFDTGSRIASQLSVPQNRLSAQSTFLEQAPGAFQYRTQIEQRIVEEHLRQLTDPRYEWMMRAAEDARSRKKERCLWFYRRTTGVIDAHSIRKSVNRQIQRFLFTRYDPNGFAKRIRRYLTKHDDYGIVKIHSPPVLLFPKTLHPVDSVA